MTTRFPLGRLVMTANLRERLEANEAMSQLPTLIARHVSGDWGDMDGQDQAANEAALEHGGRLFSAYRLGDAITVWIITEADRSATTCLLPEDY